MAAKNTKDKTDPVTKDEATDMAAQQPPNNPAVPSVKMTAGQVETTRSPEQVLGEGEGTVTMIFPRDVKVTQDDRVQVQFRKGIQEVPEHLADHWYLKANKVERYEGRKAAPAGD